MKIALIVNFNKKGATETGKRIAELLISQGVEVLFHKSSLSDLFKEALAFDNHSDLVKAADLVLTVGGDGTIIHSAKHAVSHGKPVLGVNLGRLGYVAELEADEIDMITQLVKGEYSIVNRSVLSVCVISKSGTSKEYIAVNDAVVSRGSLSRIIDLQVSIDGADVSSYRADGILVATPTGSTAYALSAGGPVISPDLRCIELVPVCPHSLSARAVILSENSVIKIHANSPDDKSYLTIDGQISVELYEDDIVEIKNSEKTLDMIVLKKRNFFKLASEKLKEVNINEA